MGVWFNDPEIDLNDIFWYNILATEIHNSLANNEGLISVDETLKIRSCYAELHRDGYENSVRGILFALIISSEVIQLV